MPLFNWTTAAPPMVSPPMAGKGLAAATTSLPSLTVVPPAQLLEPASVTVPAPGSVTPKAPLIFPPIGRLPAAASKLVFCCRDRFRLIVYRLLLLLTMSPPRLIAFPAKMKEPLPALKVMLLN